MRLRREHGAEWREVIRNQFDTLYLGILGELKIKVAEATPYHPWAKGQIERWFGTFEDQCGKTFITYCGNKPENRPECAEELRAGPGVPTLEEARTRIGQWIELYHCRLHRGDGMNGKAPLAVWATAERLRKAADTELLALMYTRGVYRVGANGVRFRVGNTELGYGATSLALRRYVGRDVLITLDPAHCEYCYAYTPERENRRFIARLDCNKRLPVDTSVEELREAIRSVKSRNKHVAEAQREAGKRMRTAGQEVAALRTEQLEEVRKTGTYDASARPAIIPVRTGFEGTAKAIRATAKRHVKAIEPGSLDDFLPTPEEEAKRERLRQAQAAERAREIDEFLSEEPEPVAVYDSPWERLKAFNARENT